MIIEKNIPIPCRRKSDILYTMNVGDSVAWKENSTITAFEATRQAAKRAAAATGFKFAVRRVIDKNECRIWRVY